MKSGGCDSDGYRGAGGGAVDVDVVDAYVEYGNVDEDLGAPAEEMKSHHANSGDAPLQTQDRSTTQQFHLLLSPFLSLSLYQRYSSSNSARLQR